MSSISGGKTDPQSMLDPVSTSGCNTNPEAIKLPAVVNSLDYGKPRKGRRLGRRRRIKAKRKLESCPEVGEAELNSLTRRSESLTLQSFKMVVEQLGYIPFNLIDVAASHPRTGRPLVVKLYPLNINEMKGRYSSDNGMALPFPTVLWLCCPEMQARVSALEDAGWVQKFQKRLICIDEGGPGDGNTCSKGSYTCISSSWHQ